VSGILATAVTVGAPSWIGTSGTVTAAALYVFVLVAAP
jgi:hypothetical protein